MLTQITPSQSATFTADGVLFDMDGTLTDSIAAVEAAWTAKAEELGLDPETVIAATHGRRASDNLMDLVPGIKKEDIDEEVDRFERSILAFADTPPQSRSGSRKSSFASSRKSSTTSGISSTSTSSGLSHLAPLTPTSVSPSVSRRGSNQLLPDLAMALAKYRLGEATEEDGPASNDSPFDDEGENDELVDMSVRILPGVRKMIDSLPTGKYAVATSGAKTYCHGCLSRTGITIPAVCVTADDPRLLRGKPHPDPFLLAAADLGIDPKRAVVFEDSPSGIKAAVASGATVIAVCTSHKKEQIDKFGAHYIVDTMEQVKVDRSEEGELVFSITY